MKKHKSPSKIEADSAQVDICVKGMLERRSVNITCKYMEDSEETRSISSIDLVG